MLVLDCFDLVGIAVPISPQESATHTFSFPGLFFIYLLVG